MESQEEQLITVFIYQDVEQLIVMQQLCNNLDLQDYLQH